MSLVKREDSVEYETSSNNEVIVEEKSKRGFLSYLKIIFISLIFLYFLWTFSSILYEGATKINVDNPTGSSVMIQFNDGEKINIPANSFKKVDLKPGNYELKVDGEIIGNFEKGILYSGEFLNPTGSIYIGEYLLYGDKNNFDKLPNNEIEAYGNKAKGPFKKYEGIYIKGDWDYGLSEKFPDEVELDISKNYEIKQKIYRFDDFVIMYNEEYVLQEE